MQDTFRQNTRLALKLDRTLEVRTVKQEQKTLKRLQACEHVVRLLEQGEHEDRSFIVMEVCRRSACCRLPAALSAAAPPLSEPLATFAVLLAVAN